MDVPHLVHLLFSACTQAVVKSSGGSSLFFTYCDNSLFSSYSICSMVIDFITLKCNS